MHKGITPPPSHLEDGLEGQHGSLLLEGLEDLVAVLVPQPPVAVPAAVGGQCVCMCGLVRLNEGRATTKGRRERVQY